MTNTQGELSSPLATGVATKSNENELEDTVNKTLNLFVKPIITSSIKNGGLNHEAMVRNGKRHEKLTSNV